MSMALPQLALAEAVPLLLEYSHTSWGAQHGAPNDVVQFAQTRDGWLWLASANGLYRFDGVRFERMDMVHGQRLHSSNVLGIMATPDGGLWVGHRFGGISEIRNGRMVLHKPGEGLPAGAVFSIARGPDGAIWASTTQGLAHLAPGARRFVTVPADTGLPRTAVHKVLFTRDGRQWVATRDGTFYREPGSQQYRRAWPTFELAAMDQAPDGTLWASNGIDKHYRVLTGAPSGNRPPEAVPGGHGIHFDRDGGMWVLKENSLERRKAPYLDEAGTAGESTAALKQLGQHNGISGALPQMWFQDREGNIWIGTSAGVDRLRRNRVHTMKSTAPLGRAGVVADAGGKILVGNSNGGLYSAGGSGVGQLVAPIQLTAFTRAPDGVVWIGSATGRWRREADGRWTSFPHPPEFAGLHVQSMQHEHGGRMWVALRRVGLYRVDAGAWTKNGGLAGLPPDMVLTLAGDNIGRTWAGYAGNYLASIHQERVRVYGDADGFALGSVQSLLADGERMWAGGEMGVGYVKGGRWTALNAPLRGVSGMVRTPNGDLWLHGSEGIARIVAAEVERVLRQPGSVVAFERFDALDGLHGSAEQVRPVPTLVQGSDGRLWFPTTTNLASMDPLNIARNPLAPPVQIVALRADGRVYEGGQVQLPTGSSELQIAYTALSLAMPERVRFRYRLHGVDRVWIDAGTRREAFYTNLVPGTYRFQVTAANEDGVWNDTGAEVSLTIPPRFFQTRWFAALMAAMAALVLYGLYRLRLRQLTRRMNDLLHARLTERARIARGLHDTLLQSVQGLIMFFNQQARRLPPDVEERKKIEQTLELADQLMSEGRDTIFDLRAAAETRELGDALRAYGRVLLSERLSVQVLGRPRELAPLVRDELQAIAREALFNSARHAGACKVDVVVDYGDDRLQLLVRDDGCGTAREQAGHYGLRGMRERAEALGAAMTLASAPGSGTVVDIVINARVAYAAMAGATLPERLRRAFSKAA